MWKWAAIVSFVVNLVLGGILASGPRTPRVRSVEGTLTVPAFSAMTGCMLSSPPGQPVTLSILDGGRVECLIPCANTFATLFNEGLGLEGDAGVHLDSPGIFRLEILERSGAPNSCAGLQVVKPGLVETPK